MLNSETFFKFFDDNPEINKEEITIIAKNMENYFCEQIISTEKDEFSVKMNYYNKRCIFYRIHDKSFSFVNFGHNDRFQIIFSNNDVIKKISTSIETSIIKNNDEKISADFVFNKSNYCFSLKYINEEFSNINVAQYFVDIFPKDIIVDNFIKLIVQKSIYFAKIAYFKHNVNPNDTKNFMKNKVEEYIKNNFDKNPQDYTEEEKFYYLLKNS